MNIVFYGERGLVNSIIADMGTDLEKHKKFISSIKLFGGDIIPWANKITEIPTYIIEASFSEFGDPDLIVVAEVNEKRYVIFIEAKRYSYDDAATILSTTNPPLLDDHKDRASKINVQLALKYRFVQAYQDMMKNNKRAVTFEEDIKKNNDDNTWIRYNDDPRKLKKKEVVDLCVQHLGNADDFYFVALTNDNESEEPYQNKDFLPPIGDCWEKQNDDCFGKQKNKFGLLTYAALEKIDVVSKKSGYYESPRKTSLGLPANTNASSNDEKIYTINMNKWTPEQERILRDFKNEIEKQLKDFKNETEEQIDVNIKTEAGSYSVIVQGKTIVKFFVSGKKDEKGLVYLVFRNENLPEELFKKEEKVKNVLVGTANRAKSFAVIHKGDAEKIMNYLDATVDFINWWEKDDLCR